MPATIKDVAREAGVAPSTVSYLLNGTAPVSENARARILQAIEKLQYRANPAARSLVLKKTQHIGLFCGMLPESGGYVNDLGLDLLRGIGEALEAADYRLLLFMTGPPADEQHMDGALYMTPHVHDPHLAQLAKRGMPLVVLGRSLDLADYWSADLDNEGDARRATEYLIGRGHRRIAFIAPCSTDYMVALDRLTGYERAMEAADLPVLPGYTQAGSLTEASGHEAAERLLALPAGQRPTAIFAAHDAVAAGALRAVRAHGLSVPGDMAVFGCDNSNLARTHGITSLSTPLGEVGRAAARLLLEAIAQPGAPCRHVAVASEIVPRETA